MRRGRRPENNQLPLTRIIRPDLLITLPPRIGHRRFPSLSPLPLDRITPSGTSPPPCAGGPGAVSYGSESSVAHTAGRASAAHQPNRDRISHRRREFVRRPDRRRAALIESRSWRGRVQLVFTSPPFPLVRKKKYGNLAGDEFARWLAGFAKGFAEFLTPDGSIVIELGNGWNPGTPTVSTTGIKALLAFQEAAGLHLCQEFICFNPARLPTPAEWVTVRRTRVKDAFTRVWWLSPTPTPKADNRRVLTEYSDSMRKLLRKGTYTGGKRPTEHHIGVKSFLTDNGGAIPANVLVPPESDTGR